ncbi:hypothetical protein [Alloactinosynnema sp. L-07]|nr:hypothetical protein [Alloactinosynnema sp. L-07]
MKVRRCRSARLGGAAGEPVSQRHPHRPAVADEQHCGEQQVERAESDAFGRRPGPAVASRPVRTGPGTVRAVPTRRAGSAHRRRP